MKILSRFIKKIVETIGRLHWKISKEAIDLNLPEFDYSYFFYGKVTIFFERVCKGIFQNLRRLRRRL